MKSHEITTQKQRLTRIQLKLLKYSDLEICKSPEQDVFNVTQRRLHKEHMGTSIVRSTQSRPCEIQIN
jgi:hypothetical protein